MKKRLKNKKKQNHKRNNLKFKDRIVIFSILLFIFSLFLFDVNANLLAQYGVEVNVPVISNKIVAATSMFWLGFIVAVTSFFIFSTRHLYKKIKPKKLDLFFAMIGAIGLGIILSGGLLLFASADNLIIPFFKWSFTRLTYYHIGIGFEVITAFYFALTN